MAIIKLGELVAGIRKSIGGATYSQNKSGPYVRRWSRGTNQRTTRQGVQRGAFAQFAAAWRDLDQADRDDWDTYAADPAQEKFNSLGESYYASGFNWFLAINCQLASVGRTPRDTFPPGARPTAPTITAFHLSDGGAPLTNITYPDGTFTQSGGEDLESENSVTAASSSGPGTAWTDPNNITANDSNNATITLASLATSQYLQGSACGFTIPTDATITGIKIYIKLSPALITAQDLQLIKSGVKDGDIKTTVGTTEGDYQTWGGLADLWGLAWTPTDINKASFGFSYRCTAGFMGGSNAVDHFKARVYYTTALTGTAYDLAIMLSQSTSPGVTVRTSKFWLVHGTQTPDHTQEFFHDGVLAAFGEPDVGWKGFISVHRQSDDGQRSAGTALNDLVT